MKNLKTIATLLLLFVTNLVFAQGVYVPYTIVNSFGGAHGTQYDIKDQDESTFYANDNNMLTLIIRPDTNVSFIKYISRDTIIDNVHYNKPNRLRISDDSTNVVIYDMNTLEGSIINLTDSLKMGQRYKFIFYTDSSDIILNELYLYQNLLTQINTEPLKVENFYNIQDGYIEPTNNSIVQLYNINGQLITELKEGNFKLETNFIYILNVLVGDGRLSKKIVLR
jgi:hypothetical protein